MRVQKNSRPRIFTVLLAISMLFSLTGCTVRGDSKQNNIETEIDMIMQREYEYSSFDDVTYTSNLKYEYVNFLSDQGMMFYDAFSKYSWELTYLYSFDDLNSYDTYAADEAKRFYNFDHPESELINWSLYSVGSWISENDYNEDVAICGKHIDDSVQKEEYELKLNEIDQTIEELVNKVNIEKSLVAKYRLIYDYLTTTIEYDYEESDSIKAGNGKICEDNYNIYGAIVKKKAVCDGISDAFKYICNKCNLECVVVKGNVDSTKDKDYGHQWNIVPINGNWFLIDCTFGLKTSDVAESYFVCDEERDGVYRLETRKSYFLYKDIAVEGRTPYKYVPISNLEGEEPRVEKVYGYPCSKYEDNNVYPKLNPKVSTESSNIIETAEGITFTCSEDFEFVQVSNDIGYALTSEAFKELLNSDNTSQIGERINLSTNAKIIGVMYYYGDNLCQIDENLGSELEIVLYDHETKQDKHEFIMLVEYKNLIYQLRFWYVRA